MASQVVGASLELLEVRSYVRGYHEYMGVWNPIQGQTLLLREPTNAKDKNTVAVLLEDQIVGHVPHNVALYFSQFLRRDFNKGFVEVSLVTDYRCHAFIGSVVLRFTLKD